MPDPDLTRPQIDAILSEQIGKIFLKASKKTLGRLVRSLLRLAARFELSAGHSPDAFVGLAIKAVLDVQAEMAKEKHS